MPDRVVQKKVSSKATVSEQFSLWLRIVVGVGGVLLIAGALISLWHPILLVSPAVRVFAAYTFSRDLGLAIVLVTALLLRARATLNGMLLLTGFIQMLYAFY